MSLVKLPVSQGCPDEIILGNVLRLHATELDLLNPSRISMGKYLEYRPHSSNCGD
jgi:hypothetical protein